MGLEVIQRQAWHVVSVPPVPSMGPGEASKVGWAKSPEGLTQSFSVKEAGPG